MKIEVLGSGCKKCKNLHEKVAEVAKNLEIKNEIEYSSDITRMMELGALSSPIFAINNKIISEGRIPSENEIEIALKNE